MIKLLIMFYFMLLLLDIILFTDFRDLMFSFLLSKRNKKRGKENTSISRPFKSIYF